MGSFASKDMTPQEQMRAYKREVDRAMRELDRERTRLERQNDKLAMDIKKAAKNNQEAVVKIMAKDYVRCKRHITKFLQLRTWLQGIGIQLQTMKSVDAMATAMKNATRVMVRMNSRLNIPQLQAIMRSFGIESTHMEDTMEVMGETMDDLFEVEGEEEAESELMKEVMAELHIEMGGKMPAAPVGLTPATTAVAAPKTAAAVGATADGPAAPTSKPPATGAGDDGPSGGSAVPSTSDLAARLAQLRAGGPAGAGKP